jgi:hypothetical protein
MRVRNPACLAWAAHPSCQALLSPLPVWVQVPIWSHHRRPPLQLYVPALLCLGDCSRPLQHFSSHMPQLHLPVACTGWTRLYLPVACTRWTRLYFPAACIDWTLPHLWGCRTGLCWLCHHQTMPELLLAGLLHPALPLVP